MKIRPIYFFLLIFFSHFYAVSQTDPNHPNIILIIADDLGVDASNGYQNSALLPTTPTLDNLRTNGLTFMNAWSYPVCTPTRAATMSGKYGIITGVTNVPGNLDITHTSIFKEIATQTGSLYSDAVIGKWHIAMPSTNLDHPQQHDVDFYDGLYTSGVSDYYEWDKVTNGVESVEMTYATSYFTDAAINWVNAQNNPWFLWLAEVAPHSPFHEPPSDLYTISPIGSNMRKYIAAIEAMDAEIGRLLNNIPSDVLDNTLIIYIGDNGTPGNVIQNYDASQSKGTLYQGGIHVPMTVSGSLVTRVNETEDAMVFVTDIYATILEATGTDLPGGIYNSLSFLPLLSDSNAVKRNYNYSEIESPDVDGWTIRNDQYKLIELEDGTQEFYDLINDPLEIDNLISSLTQEQETIKSELEQEAADLRTGSSCNDLIQNGSEEGIDCGGPCAACSSLGVDTVFDDASVSIFPNPANDFITIQSGRFLINTVQLYTLTGKLVYSNQDVRKSELTINLPSLSNQTYIIKLSSDLGVVHKLLMKRG